MTIQNEEFNLEKFYNLIINSQDSQKTFLDNLDLWKAFYNNRSSIIRENILDERLFTIIEFLLGQEKGEIFDYFHSNLIETLEFEQTKLAFRIRDSFNKAEENIEQLWNNLSFHDQLCKTISTLNLDDIFGSFRKYQSKTLELYTVDSLIVTLYEQFFKLPEDLVKKTLYYIANNPVLLQKSEVNKNLMNVDLIFQYLEKILPIKEFLNEDTKDDPLVSQIKNLEIKDKKIVMKFFKSSSPKYILSMFDEKVENFIAYLENIPFLDELEKQNLFNYVMNKVQQENIESLYPLITKEISNPLWKHYAKEDTYNQILSNLKSEVPLALTSDEIKFLLSNDQATNNFTINMIYFMQQEDLLSHKDFDLVGIKDELNKHMNRNWNFIEKISEDKKKFQEKDSLTTKFQKSTLCEVTGTIIPFEVAIELLKGYLTNQIELNQMATKAIIRSIANYTLNQLLEKHHGIYFFDNVPNPNSNKVLLGYFEPDLEIIALNSGFIDEFLNKKESLYNRLSIFNTLFHEIEHAKIHQNRKDNIWNIEAYEMEKERTLREYDCKFYHTNYVNVKEEIEARINGAEYLFKFIETYLPEHLGQIQDQTIKELEKENKLKLEQNNSSRKMDFLQNVTLQFQEGFDTLIKYNPNILQEHPIFQLEYHPTGKVKTIDETWLEKTEVNKDLIEEISKRRYPEIYNQELKSTYGK